MEKKIGIIGLGYVGLPLAVEFSNKFQVIGFDKNEKRIEELNYGHDRNLEVKGERLETCKNLDFSNNINDLENCDIYIITVPTPVNKYKNPDMSFLSSASKEVASVLSKGNIVIYESTVYPGATEEYCVPVLEKYSKLKYNIDFFCGYSPERINPGDKNHNLTKIKKITSGSNDEIANIIDNLYKSIIPAGTFKASSISIAESAKVIENIQRDVNIALINELAIIFNKLSLDTNEILEAAGTKWNFLPFKPGLVGGHCIGVDPYYLTHKSIEIGYIPEMILAGRKINDSMSQFIVDLILTKIAKAKLNPLKLKVGVFGLTFKENCPDMRNTQVKNIVEKLKLTVGNISITDPYAYPDEVKSLFDIELSPLNKITNLDIVILAVSHDEYKKIKLKEWLNIFNNKEGIFIDIKSVFEKDYFINSKIKHWRL
jgi:UDP-N-acetyl-D-glucosamine/UDP-N-acetyl-D-galactosamine dehydrogenase